MPDPETLDALPLHDHQQPSAADYRLRVDGMVQSPLELSIDDLLALPQQDLVDDFTCLAGWTVPGIRWRGVPLNVVLDHARVRPEARYVQASVDGFSLPLPIEDAHRAFLALSLDGEPIPPQHGAPVRLLVAGGECFTSVKWLNHLELREVPGDNTAEKVARARLASELAG